MVPHGAHHLDTRQLRETQHGVEDEILPGRFQVVHRPGAPVRCSTPPPGDQSLAKVRKFDAELMKA